MNELKQTLVDNYKVVSIVGCVLGVIIIALNIASIAKGMNAAFSIIGIVFGVVAVVFSIFTFVKGIR